MDSSSVIDPENTASKVGRKKWVTPVNVVGIPCHPGDPLESHLLQERHLSYKHSRDIQALLKAFHVTVLEPIYTNEILMHWRGAPCGISWETFTPMSHGRVVLDCMTLDAELKSEAHVRHGHLPIKCLIVWTLV